MECPHCQKDIPSVECPDCGNTVPMQSKYCMECGIRFEEASEPYFSEDDALELDDRILCSDGTCTGIIVDGACSECGKPSGATE